MKKKWIATIHLDTLEIESDPSFKFRCLENCAECCFRLEVPLRDEDIERLEELGYSTWEFVDYEKMFYRGDRFLGYALKKRPFDGGCIFLQEDGKCKVYPHRPLACKLYPFVLIRKGNTLEVYIKEEGFCKGINHPQGEPFTLELVKKYFWEIVEDYRRKLGFSEVS